MMYVQTQPSGFGWHPGLAALDPTSQKIAQFGTMGAQTTAAAVIGSVYASGGTVLGLSASAAIPIVGAAIAGVSLLVMDLIANSGCGQTCIVTSQWANQAEPLLAKNIAAYFALPSPRTKAQQVVALANFDTVWQRLVQMCSDPAVGDAGKRCISDRQSGACTWKQTANSPLLQYPGEPQPGECWNWQSGYRDPIANDPVVDDSEAPALPASFTNPSSSLLPLAAIAGLVLLGVLT